MPANHTLAAAQPSVTPPCTPPGPDWTTISRLMAGCETAGRPLLADDPSLGWTVNNVRPAAILLLEPAEPLMAVDPQTRRTFDLQVELLVRGGFGRFPLDASSPVTLPGWSVRLGPSGLELMDASGDVWAAPNVTPGPRWMSTVDDHGQVSVLYGAWLGVRAPRYVSAYQYGPAQRAAELRAARIRNLVAAATVCWTSQPTRQYQGGPPPRY
ncbi:hypothetical protein GCM10009827_119370 [Dactylosporangium maewongense]|uniref:Uncharacterized protein n=1 Tax=Dactylosporangium maewongense TaxID=634393 RepID=A0ABP4PBV6_9ACTN